MCNETQITCRSIRILQPERSVNLVPFVKKKPTSENVQCNNPVMDDRNYQHIYKPTNDKEFEGHITMNMHGGHTVIPRKHIAHIIL